MMQYPMISIVLMTLHQRIYAVLIVRMTYYGFLGSADGYQEQQTNNLILGYHVEVK